MNNNPTNQDSLRAAAEAKIAHAHMPKQMPRPADKLLHELRVHQIELEMQNETLRQSQVELEKSRDRYVDFYDFAPVGYITLNHNGIIDVINLTGAALLGVERNKLPYHRFASYVAVEDRDRWYHFFLEALKRVDTVTCELSLRHEAGEHLFVRLDCLRKSHEDQEPMVSIVMTDISENKRTQDALFEQEEFFRMITENVEDFIAVLDLEGIRLYNNPSYGRFFGDTEALKGTDSFAEIHPDDRERIRQLFKDTVESGVGHRAEFKFVLANGDVRHMESCGALMRNSQGEARSVVVVSHDITARKQTEDETYKLAFFDPLTGLPNRRLLNDRLSQTMAASKRSGRYGALMFLDLDNFKPLNDKHGHGVGDLLLIEVAHRISSCVREMDTVARFGGDEFLVMLGELEADKTESTAQAGIVAEKIRIILAEPYLLTIQHKDKSKYTIEHHCTSSIGVVLFINHEASMDDILRWADLTMYQAKEDGRNLIRFFEPSD